MNRSENTLVVLIDGEDLRDTFPAWPGEICLAACLSRDGDCNMVVFLREERAVIPERLVRMLDLPADDVCFVPEVRGYATTQFLYSDERRLMALVASDPAILEEAIDYAVNYTYALEEGLDPAVVLGLKRDAAAARQPDREEESAAQIEAAPFEMPAAIEVPRQHARVQERISAPAQVNPLLPEFLRRSVENARRPMFASVRKHRPMALMPQV
jgi:hypothetical protein